MRLSNLAESLIGSEIVKLGNAINDRIRNGETIYNFTIGDFDSSIFPIPKALEDGIVNAYRSGYTTYPAAEGILELRQSVSAFLKQRQGIDYATNEIQIASGGRPLIYTIFKAIVDKGDKVIYATPSWNNNHYVHINEGEHCLIEATPKNNFMPTAEQIAPHIPGATLLALCSPQNPTGTTFAKLELQKICDLVLAENNRRGPNQKKLYVMFDQMYWTLTFGDIEHFNPVILRPAMKEFTIFVDGVSKVFCATGVRVGWAFGPSAIIAKLKALLSHIGAWAPMAEQKATAAFLQQKEDIDTFLMAFKDSLAERLFGIYGGIMLLKQKGYRVNAVYPQAAMYLAIQIDLVGKTTIDGMLLQKQADVTSYLLAEAKLAIVPFSAFGGPVSSAWYRLSVGTCKKDEIKDMLGKLETALGKLV